VMTVAPGCELGRSGRSFAGTAAHVGGETITPSLGHAVRFPKCIKWRSRTELFRLRLRLDIYKLTRSYGAQGRPTTKLTSSVQPVVVFHAGFNEARLSVGVPLLATSTAELNCRMYLSE
jgi:hypothetical protein